MTTTQTKNCLNHKCKQEISFDPSTNIIESKGKRYNKIQCESCKRNNSFPIKLTEEEKQERTQQTKQNKDKIKQQQKQELELLKQKHHLELANLKILHKKELGIKPKTKQQDKQEVSEEALVVNQQ